MSGTDAVTRAPDIAARASAEPAGSRTESLLREVRQMPLFRQLVPMEAGVGWPIMVRRVDGTGARRVYLRLPLYGYRPTPVRGQGAVLYPPFATLTLRWDTGRPVEYVDLAYTQPWPVTPRPEPVGTFPHDAVRGSRREYLAERAELLRKYDEMADRLANDIGFTADWIDAFSRLLSRLVEPGLLAYYRVLGGSFYDRFLGPAPGDAPAPDRP